ncbi:MAG TPA: aromatic acid exporter family protein [Propionibacteriaceae bacterium]|nr:aromatic acid exporter family protein [Propionibacteriaceae bacterium]
MREPEGTARVSLWDRLATLIWPHRPPRWREVPSRLQPTLMSVLRLTAAAVVSYLLTLVLTEGALDLTGPLTALLVVQASAYSTLKMGLVRVGAVLSGVLVATSLSTWIGLTWWSLGAAIAASLLLAKVLRLGEQALEVPISAMLILGVSNHEIAAEIRILNTLIGAGVGVAFNLVYPPAMPTRRASEALLKVAAAGAYSLDTAADSLAAGPVTRTDVESWLDRVRTTARDVANATEIIAAVKDSRRFNPRALGTADVEPVLTSGLVTLEHCLLAIRALFVVLHSEIPPEEQPDDPYGEELRQAFAVVLHDAADCLRAFGSLVVAEADGREEETEQALAESLDILRETQAIMTELIMMDAQENTSSWLLRGSILAAVEQVLARLNLEDRARMRRRWQEEQARHPLAQLPPIIQGVLPHPEHPYPRGIRPSRWRRLARSAPSSSQKSDETAS